MPSKASRSATPRVLAFDGLLPHGQATKRIKKLLKEGSYTCLPYAQRRMEERRITTIDAETIIKGGHVSGHSRSMHAWRYFVEGKLETGKRAACVVELHGNLAVIINTFPLSDGVRWKRG